MKLMLMSEGMDTEKIEELMEDKEIEKKALKDYDEFINDKTRYKPLELIIDAYEGILQDRRVDEKTTLNKKRFREYERNRPPQDHWYELKDRGF